MRLSEVASLLLYVCLIPSSCFMQDSQRRPDRFLIPEGYVGWVMIKYQVKGAPALPIEDGRYLITFPISGRTQTSSEQEYGWASDDYFYYSPDGRRHQLKVTTWGSGGMIWGRSNGKKITDSNEVIYGRFFVGTEEEFKRNVSTPGSGPPDP